MASAYASATIDTLSKNAYDLTSEAKKKKEAFREGKNYEVDDGYGDDEYGDDGYGNNEYDDDGYGDDIEEMAVIGQKNSILYLIASLCMILFVVYIGCVYQKEVKRLFKRFSITCKKLVKI